MVGPDLSNESCSTEYMKLPVASALKLYVTYTGPIGHYFYHGMDKVVTRYFKIGTFGFVVAKVLGDELLFGPIHVGGYFAWMTLAEGGSWQVSETELSQSG